MTTESGGLSELITVGEIVAPHGVTGVVRVVPTTDFPERFRPDMQFLVDTVAGRRTLTVIESQPHKAFLLVRFREIRNRDEAENLRGARLQVPESELVPLNDGEFYRFQLLDLTVVTQEGIALGTIEDILETGANDVFVVRPADPARTRPILLPATREVVVCIDPEHGVMRVQLLPGLLEV